MFFRYLRLCLCRQPGGPCSEELDVHGGPVEPLLPGQAGVAGGDDQVGAGGAARAAGLGEHEVLAHRHLAGGRWWVVERRNEIASEVRDKADENKS